MANSSLEAEVEALHAAFEQCRKSRIRLDLIFTDCIFLARILQNEDDRVNSRIADRIKGIRSLLNMFPFGNLEERSRDRNGIVDCLANHAC